MTRLEAQAEADRLRMLRSVHDIARGVDYTVGLFISGGEDDHYLISIPPFR